MWFVDLSIPAPDELSAVLPAEELARAARYAREEDRRRYRVGRAILRKLLHRYTGVAAENLVFEYDTNGKPSVAERHAGKGAHFNLSHSGDLALYAFSTLPLGIDVEQIRAIPEMETLAARVLTPHELAGFGTSAPDDRTRLFYRYWCSKEAIIKAGSSTLDDMGKIEVALDGSPIGAKVRTGTERHPNRWALYEIEPRNGYTAALVTPETIATLRFWRW